MNDNDRSLLPLDAVASYNSAFSEESPGLQRYWDSMSYQAFLTCPRYYYYTIVQGYHVSGRSVDLAFGIAWHSATERYDRLIALGYSHDEALFWTVAETYYRQLKTPEEKEIGYGFHEEGIPEGKNQKTPWTLIRALVVYLTQFGKEDPLHTIILPSGQPAVELSFSFNITQDFFYGGHMDRLVSKHEQIDLSSSLPERPHIYNTDRKTTTSVLNSRYWTQWVPDVQMSGYDLASKVILPVPAKGIIIDAVSLSVTGEEFGRLEILRSPEQTYEFVQEFEINMERAKSYAEKGFWPRNPISTACRRYGRDCEFRDVCSISDSSRKKFLKANYVRKFWNPREER